MLDPVSSQVSAEASAAEMARRGREPCARCGGRLLSSGSEGDLACFSCGHRVYAWAPEVDPQVRRRGASHGGNSLE